MTTNVLRRSLTGVVTSNKGDKTIVVRIKRRVMHPLLKKYITKSSKIHAHDENNVANMGDTVLIQECRPYSKMKSWILIEVTELAKL